MAKGKQAAMAANRRTEAAHAVIDRLTSELAEAKVRAREAERRAAIAETKARRCDELEEERRSDRALAAACESLKWWRKVQREDLHRRKAAIAEVGDVLIPDVGATWPGALAHVDAFEFVLRRYPRIVEALLAGDVGVLDGKSVSRSHLPATARRFSDDEIKRFQRLRGERGEVVWEPEADMADVLADVLDAKQLGFVSEDVFQLLGIKREAS